MRIYDAAAHQKYEEVLRSLGALLDQRGMSEISVNQTDEGFMVQGLALIPGEERAWDDPDARRDKETLQLREDDLMRFMDEALARRQGRGPRTNALQLAAVQAAGFYETALRVIGKYVDMQQPRDVFFFEQDHQFVLRLLMDTRVGLRHVLVEFTRDEVDSMIAQGQQARGR